MIKFYIFVYHASRGELVGVQEFDTRDQNSHPHESHMWLDDDFMILYLCLNNTLFNIF